MMSAVSHAHLTNCHVLESLSLEQKMVLFGQNSMYETKLVHCFACQEGPGDPVVLGFPAIALLSRASGPHHGPTPNCLIFAYFLNNLSSNFDAHFLLFQTCQAK